MSERRRRVFPETLKREAVGRAATSGLPIVRVAEELGLNQTVLRRWIAWYAAEGTAPQRRLPKQAAAPSLGMRQTLHAGIAIDALRMAIERQRPAPGLIRHSGRVAVCRRCLSTIIAAAG